MVARVASSVRFDSRITPIVPFAPERIAVFRALQLGDMLVAVPAFRALRARFPHARITLVGLPWARDFARRFVNYIDDFIAFPGGCGLPERNASAAEEAEFFRDVGMAQFDLALQLHGSGQQTNPIVTAFGARDCAGFYVPGHHCPDPERFVPFFAHEPEVRRLLRLLEFLGIPARGEDLEFAISSDEWRAAARLRESFGLRPGHYACIHPGARAATRRWPPERFAHVADALAAKGLQVVLTGTDEERDITQAVVRAMLAPCVDLTGQAPIGIAGALYTGARVLVCNDTGISHVAAGLSVRSVVIYLASSPERWAPLNTELHRRVMHPVDCRPCSYSTCPVGHRCAVGVTVEDVVGEVERLL